MKRVNLNKLTKLIDASVEASNAMHKDHAALYNYCEEVWGFQPADKDLDYIIDLVFGGCGGSSGMDAQEFADIMNAAK